MDSLQHLLNGISFKNTSVRSICLGIHKINEIDHQFTFDQKKLGDSAQRLLATPSSGVMLGHSL